MDHSQFHPFCYSQHRILKAIHEGTKDIVPMIPIYTHRENLNFKKDNNISIIQLGITAECKNEGKIFRMK